MAGLLRPTMFCRCKQVPLPTLLQAYHSASQTDPAFRPRYLELLGQIEKSEPKNVAMREILARHALEDPRAASDQVAIRYLQRTIELGSAWAPDYELLGDLLVRSGRVPEGISVFKRGIELNPYAGPLYVTLAEAYLSGGNQADAVHTLEQGLKLFPEDSSMRELLKKLAHDERAP